VPLEVESPKHHADKVHGWSILNQSWDRIVTRQPSRLRLWATTGIFLGRVINGLGHGFADVQALDRLDLNLILIFSTGS
jgi:hypothetical protein